MKRPTVRNSALALVGLASLAIYILACTSFSLDDKRVLYPTFDSASRSVGVAVYDRDSGRSELLFVPHLRVGEEAGDKPTLLRPQWLPDGRSVLVAWPGTDGTINSDDSLSLAVLPVGGRGPVRLFHLADLPNDAASRLSLPLCVTGNQLFLQGKSNTVVRLDLVTGVVKRQVFAKEVIPYASPLPDRPCYVTEKGAAGGLEVGFLDPETFALAPIVSFDNEESRGDGGLLTLSRDGRTAAFVTDNSKQPPVILFKASGKPARKSPKLAADDEKLSLGSAQFSPGGDVLYASFVRHHGDATNSTLGFLEVPTNGKPARRVTLIQRGPKVEEEGAFYFQIGVSHDGKTLAVASTYMAFAGGKLRPNDCALFLVDLGDSERKVTKVPIRLPPKSEEPEDRMETLAHLFGWVCGQPAEHTWAPGGLLLPCCQRCAGLYAGACGAALLHLSLRPRLSGRFLEMHGVFLALMVPFGFHWLPQGPALRASAGVLFGFAVVTFLWLVPGAQADRSATAQPAAASTLSYWAGVAFTAALVPALGLWGGSVAAMLLGGLAFAGLLALGLLAVTNVAFGLTTATWLARRAFVVPPSGGPAPAVDQTPGRRE